MDVRLLRMARRDKDGNRTWIVPGYAHAFKAYRGGSWGDVLTLSWPHTDKSLGTVRRGCRFDWHGRVAFHDIRRLLAG